MSAGTTTTRHAVIDSPIGPLTVVRDDDGFDEFIAQLNEYFAGQREAFDLPLTPQGSDRARRVWRLLTEIPYGQTTTYGALACAVGSTGKLTGYAGGLDRKQHLLELEKAIPVAPQSLW